MATKRNFYKKRFLIVGVVLLGLLLAAPVALAAEFRGGDRVVIGADEVIEDDLYVGAGKFTLDGTIKGDLIVAGGTIEINGTVEGDLMAAGQSSVINGVVADDARIVGYALTLSRGAQVDDDVIAVGFSLEDQEDSSVGGGLLYAGGQVLLAGDVAEDVKVAGGSLKLSGSVGGNVDAEVGEAEEGPPTPFFMAFMPGVPAVPSVPMGLTVDEGASIGGNLIYTSRTKVSIPAGVVAGKVTRREPAVEEEEIVVSPTERAANWFLGHLPKLVTLLVVGLLLLWIVPDWTQEAATALQAKPLPSLGWGIVATIAVFVVILIISIGVVVLDIILGRLGLGGLVASITGLGIIGDAMLLVSFLITAFYVTKVVFGFLIGRLLLERIQPAWAAGRVWPLVIGLVLFVIFRAIPYIGWLIGLIVTLLGLGGLWLMGREALRRAAPA